MADKPDTRPAWFLERLALVERGRQIGVKYMQFLTEAQLKRAVEEAERGAT